MLKQNLQRALSLLALTGLLLGVFPLSILAETVAPQPTAAFERLTDPPEIDYQLYERDLIEIKFSDNLTVRFRDGKPTDLNGDSLAKGALGTAFAQVSGGEWSRSHTVSEADIDSLRASAERNSAKAMPDLNNYYRLQLPAGMEAAEAIALFSGLPNIEGAYPVPKAVEPPAPPDYTSPNDDNFDPILNRNVYQRYLDPAPDGLDFRYAWQGTDGAGDGVKICDVEYGWNSSHADLPGVTLLGGAPDPTNPSSWWEHGTAVLGELAALDNGWGATGMAHDASIYFAAADTTAGGFNVASAVTQCASNLSGGDVILIEQQTSGPNATGSGQQGLVPVEWVKSTYDAIVVAVGAGIVVVEAAGNGSENLDDAVYSTGNGGHHPFLSGNDSGAIIVGSANSPYSSNPRSRLSSSTYGSTVDLQGWGEQIMTTGYGTYYSAEGPNLWYRRDFSGTSGASPMVAAAAAIYQATYKLAHGGTPAAPGTVKAILQNTGTPQSGSQNIGPQPDLKAAIEAIWNVTPPVAPTISPPGGTYNMPIQVYIDYGDSGQNSSNTHLRYTLNGSEPTIDSFIFIPEQGDSIYLNYGATVKVKAFQSNPGAGRVFESATTSAVYVSSTPQVAEPIITPGGGYYNEPHQVTISTSTPGATIRYRTDGRNISFFYPGTLYTGPIDLSAGSYEITAKAYKDGYYKSDQAESGPIEVAPTTLPSPTIYPNGGNFAGEVTVYMGSTVLGTSIHYTLDGSPPTTASPLFVNPLAITETATVKAIAHLDGYTDSPATEATFNITQQAATPVINPNGGVFSDTVAVSLSSSTPNATIRYTTNGAEPTSYSTAYTGVPFNLGIGQHIIKAKAFLGGADPSATATAEFTVYDTVTPVAVPKIDPPAGQYNGPITVTMTTDTEGAFIFYTTDGSDPQTSGTVQSYNGPFLLYGNSDTYYVSARAFKSGIGNSDRSPIASLTVVTPTNGTVMTPTISMPGGVYTNNINITIAAPDHNPPFVIRRLYITTDGTPPIVNTHPISGNGTSTPHNKSIFQPQVVSVIAGQVGYLDSPIVSEEYFFVCDDPKIMPDGGAFTDTATITMTTGTAVGKIYYTLNGDEPTEADTLYTTPFTVPVGIHSVKAKCFKTNYDPSETALSVITVNATPVSPTIISQPVSQTVTAGQAVSFTVEVSATPEAEYQWQRDGINLAGETLPVLELDAARLADAGYYQAIAWNSAGTVTSTAALLTVEPLTTSLSIAKLAHTNAVSAGDEITYTLTLTNDGALTATAQVIDTFTPAEGVGSASVSGASCNSLSGGVLTCTAEIPPYSSTTVTLVAQSFGAYSGTLTNTAGITGSGYFINLNPNNSSGPVAVAVTTPDNLQLADLGISKTRLGTGVITAGNRISYTFSLTNYGPTTPVSATIIDSFSDATALAGVSGPGCSWTMGQSAVSCAVTNIISGTPASLTLVITASASFSGTLSNTATVEIYGDFVDPNPSNDSAGPVSVSIITPPVDPGLYPAVSAVSPADGESDVTLNAPLWIDYSAMMNTASVSVTLSPSLPLTPSWSMGDTRLTLSHPDFATATVYTATVVTGTNPGGYGLTNAPYTWVFTTGTSLTPEADLGLSKSVQGEGTTYIGGPITYTFAIRNLGPASPVTATLVDTFSDASALQSVSGSGCSWSSGSAVVTCTVSAIITATPSALNLYVTAAGGYQGPLSNTAQIYLEDGLVDPNPANDIASASVMVIPLPDGGSKVYLPLILK